MIRSILVGACASLSLAACAHKPESVLEAKAEPAAPAAQVNCLTTGTRIPLKAGQCAMAPGRVYTQEELQRTGAFTPAEALRRLDPAIR